MVSAYGLLTAACGDENIRQSRVVTDQTIFAVRVVSSYVTFYKAEIPTAYWKELARRLPQKQSITILRWPGGANDKDEAISLLVKRHFLPFYEHQDEYILY